MSRVEHFKESSNEEEIQNFGHFKQHFLNARNLRVTLKKY